MTRRSIALWIIIFLVFIVLAIQFSEREGKEEISLTEFFALAEQKRIADKVVDSGDKLEGYYVTASGRKQQFFAVYHEGWAEKIAEAVREYNLDYKVKKHSALFQQIFFSVILPILFIFVLWMIIMRQIQSGGNKAMAFGRARARLVKEGQVKVTFDDVAGIDEAKEELKEIVEFLKNPKKFSRLGGRIPKGVLLYGLPGTGKTLLARAVAGEAGVPFLTISGSDFVEMFVGVGASRVRDLFEQGKRSSPCLLFIDEIDAVGRQRFSGIGGGHDEREQTLNQLLVEMDGFNPNEGVILIAATNRPDVLDPALLRPGRFDRQIAISLPDLTGRKKILEVHSHKIRLAPGVDLIVIARGTPGFSGADLENLVNESALLAARKNKEYVELQDLEEAKDRVMMGPERRSLVLAEKEKLNTAYHEVGHALCAKLLPGSDPVHKVTIIPRGRSLGATSILPGEDRHLHSRSQLQTYLVHLMGGRSAEEIMNKGDFSTGAADDLHKATELAFKMICEFGMSDRLTPRSFVDPGAQIFLGKELAQPRHHSEATAKLIDEEINQLLEQAHQKALQLLKDNHELLERTSRILVERETLTGEELDQLIEGKELKSPETDVSPEKPVDEKKESPDGKKAPKLGIKFKPGEATS